MTPTTASNRLTECGRSIVRWASFRSPLQSAAFLALLAWSLFFVEHPPMPTAAQQIALESIVSVAFAWTVVKLPVGVGYALRQAVEAYVHVEKPPLDVE